MRDLFHDELDVLNRSLVDIIELTGEAIEQATAALLHADVSAAAAVQSIDDAIEQAYSEVERRGVELLARQQPMAKDLRRIITSLRMIADAQRMGELAVHIAEVGRRRHPASAVPAHLHPTIVEMGRIAQALCAKCAHAIAGGDVRTAAELDDDDDAMDALHRRLFAVLLDPGWDGGVEYAVDLTLCGRYYERFCDHAVSIAQRVVYLVTGERAAIA